MALRTKLNEKLAIRHPVLLGPMGFVSGGVLAAGVSAAGGLGIIGGGYADPEWLERELAAAGIYRACARQPLQRDLAWPRGGAVGCRTRRAGPLRRHRCFG